MHYSRGICSYLRNYIYANNKKNNLSGLRSISTTKTNPLILQVSHRAPARAMRDQTRQFFDFTRPHQFYQALIPEQKYITQDIQHFSLEKLERK